MVIIHWGAKGGERREVGRSWVYFTQKGTDDLYVPIYNSKPYQFNINLPSSFIFPLIFLTVSAIWEI